MTGGSRGIGRATAVRLAGAGARVLVVARSAGALEQLVAEVRASGGQAWAYVADIGDPGAVSAVVERVLGEHGRVDVLVNNAGKSIRRSVGLYRGGIHDFQLMIDVNFLGPVGLTLGLLPGMRCGGPAKIVNVSSVGVQAAPFPRWGGYQASKTAFDVWLRAVAPEVRGDGVRITSVYMGVVDTAMSAPTPSLYRVPPLGVEQAAGLVCAAVASRRASIGPWWGPLAGFGAEVFRGPVEAGFAVLARRSADTPLALATAEGHSYGGQRFDGVL